MQTTSKGWGSGLLGVVIFSGSLPATRVAVMGFSPWFLTSARAIIAAALGLLLLGALREKRPSRGDLVSLSIVAIGELMSLSTINQWINSYVAKAGQALVAA